MLRLWWWLTGRRDTAASEVAIVALRAKATRMQALSASATRVEALSAKSTRIQALSAEF